MSDNFESFQRPAVREIVDKFSTNPTGRFLLSIPTGGGKTITAARAVVRLFEDGVFDMKSDVVLWTAHRKELLDQAADALKWVGDKFEHQTLPNVELTTIQAGANTKGRAEFKLVVIDEAHHSKAPSYQHLFGNKNIGILGLTATPSRHDGEPLQFDEEAYSIGFPDLVRKKVILRPKILRINGGTYDEITSIDNSNQLEVLNTPERNRRIIQCIGQNSGIFQKIVIYVGTTQHVHDLYDEIKRSPVFSKYESVSWITQNGNSRNIDRRSFFDAEREQKRSIIINVNILTEGYDDPSINTAILAMPTRSKLYYMQAMGRAIRLDPSNLIKNSFVVEVETKLPNISYQIDNRWLYSDVMDLLEPKVEDVVYSSSKMLVEKIETLYNRFDVPTDWRRLPNLKQHERYSMLLFKQYRKKEFRSLPIFLTGENRQNVVAVFNRLSKRMSYFVGNNFGLQQIENSEKGHSTEKIIEKSQYSIIIDSMRNAYCHLIEETQTPLISEGHPWVTFVSFVYHEDDGKLPIALMEFVNGMVNKEEIIATVCNREYELGDVILRLPLPLKNSFGKLVSAEEGRQVTAVVDSLGAIRDSGAPIGQSTAVSKIMYDAVLPIEVGYANSLVIIAREDSKYLYDLSVD